MSAINAGNALQRLSDDTTRVNYQNQRKNLGTGRLDRQGFLQLIMAQIQNQDPTAPSDQTQMLSQQLQLEMADQMNSMVAGNTFNQAGSMIGKKVDLFDAKWDFDNNASLPAEFDAETGMPKVISGVVESVQFDRARNKALLKINGNYYDLEQVKQVSQQPVSSGGTGTGAVQ